MRLLTEAHTEDPADFTVTHALALMSLWRLVRRGSSSDPPGLSDWQLCLGLWANLLADPRFWISFAADANRRYRATVPAADVDAVRDRLEQWLSDTVTRCGGAGIAAALALEVRAARLVAVRGGIAAGPTRQPIPCGPLLISHLELDEECRRLAAGLLASRDERTRRAAMYFSRLGTALVHLDNGKPAAALTCLEELWCSRCRQRGSKLSAAPRVCRDTCAKFDELNPAYADLRAGRRRFLVAATTLTAEAHLRIAEAALSGAELDVDKARKHWRAAARLAGSADLIHDQVQRFVLPRVRFLLGSRRRDDAIAVLRALPSGSAAADDEVFGEAIRSLSQLLTMRGVAAANREPANLVSAEEDLRTAVKLNPMSWSACRNLVVILENAAMFIVSKPEPSDADFGSATKLLTEARERLMAFSSNVERTEIDTSLRSISEGLAAIWNAQAVRAHERGHHQEALRRINQALVEMPDDTMMASNRDVIQEAIRRQELFGSLGKRSLDDYLAQLEEEIRVVPAHDPHYPSHYFPDVPVSRWRRAWRALRRWADRIGWLVTRP